MFFLVQGDSKRGGETGSGSGHEDSDLERKRREAEALLQSVGITPDIPHGNTQLCMVLKVFFFHLSPIICYVVCFIILQCFSLTWLSVYVSLLKHLT